MSLGPGTYPGTSEFVYHADPCEQPSLSASIANVLLSRSPLHAWAAHPRLNPEWQPTVATKGMDLGTLLHLMILEGGGDYDDERVVIVEATDWRTKVAQTMRDEARQRGATPILVKDWQEARVIALTARRQLERSELGGMLAGADYECTAVWREANGVYCRTRMDLLSADRRLIVDLKTTEGSASPDAFVRRILDGGYDLQGAMYARGIEQLTGTVPQFVFATIEVDPPCALSLVGLSPGWIALAERKRVAAVRMWEECLRTGDWPGYPTRVCWADMPAWAEAAQMEREMRPTAEEVTAALEVFK